MKRTAAAFGAAIALFAIAVGSAHATHCSVVNKPIGSGEAGTATVNVVTGVFTITSLNLTPSGHMKGNFLTVTVIGPGGVVLAVDSVFGKKDLPEGAHLSGPGGSPCDGVGIDDLAACGM
ncbi:MAG TPA: hypothetical protein VFB87_10805 [Gaiellaceae bacterium]|nr:hypothetical protein [Gaiellaceae bacterium]